MNILYIVHDNKKGGAALSFLEMISYISKEHNVYVLTPHKNGFLPQKLDEMQIPHSNAHYFWWKTALPSNPILAFFRSCIYSILNLWNPIEAKRIKKQISNMKFDIIHSNSSVINFGALLSKETGIPHIWHLREYGEEDFSLKKVIAETKYSREMNEYAVGYIAISKSIKQKFSSIVGESKIYHIYNGVSEDYQYEKKFEDDLPPKVKFLIAGNYCKEKGQDDVIKAVLELRKQKIDDFEVYLAGNGDFAKPKRLAAEYDLENYVTFCGLVDDMVQLRKEVDVEIVASKCEAFGRVTIEAMRMSNPVIGTNAGGTPELISDGKDGFLFEYGDYIGLAECMKKFIDNRQLIRQMGQNSYGEMKDKFTPMQNAIYIMDLYKQIVN